MCHVDAGLLTEEEQGAETDAQPEWGRIRRLYLLPGEQQSLQSQAHLP